MNDILREIKKHLQIYILFIKFSVMSQMEYRANFLGNMAMETGYLFVKLSYAVVVYRSGSTIKGMSADEILFFIGTFIMLTGVYAGLFMINNFGLRLKILNGDLDLLLTKPISLQFMATMRQVDMTIFAVDAIAGLVVVVIAWVRLGIPLTVVTLGGYLMLIALSSIVGYSLFLLPQILSFWLLNTSAIASITDSFWDFNSMPMGIYTAAIQFVGVFIIPIFVITNFPPLFVLGRMPNIYLLWAWIIPIVSLYIVRMAWQRGVRSYDSASS